MATVSQNLSIQINIKRSVVTSYLIQAQWGQDASIVIIKSAAGCCADINKSVSFHGRVIGKIIVTA